MENYKLFFRTDEEIKLAREQAKTGPFKSFGDLVPNSPNDWERISNNAMEFMKDPSKEIWKGEGNLITPVKTGSIEPAKEGLNLNNAAYYGLVMENPTVLEEVKKALLVQASEPMTDFSNTVRWAPLNDINPVFIISEWVARLFMGYIFSWESFSYTEHLKMKKFFVSAAFYFKSNIDNTLNKLFVDRAGGNYTLKDPNRLKPSGKFTHLGGYSIPDLALWYNNRRITQQRVTAFVGVLYDIPQLKASAKMMFQEWLKFGIFQDGTSAEGERNTEALTDQGLAYAFSAESVMSQIADVFARDGDSSLYDFETSEGAGGTEGGNKSLLLTIKNTLSHIDGSLLRYTGRISEETKIDGIQASNNWYSVFDSSFAQANIYYQDKDIQDIYLRRKLGTYGFPLNAANSGSLHPWGTVGAVLPGVLFMFAGKEGRINPYPKVPYDFLKDVVNLIGGFKGLVDSITVVLENYRQELKSKDGIERY